MRNAWRVKPRGPSRLRYKNRFDMRRFLMLIWHYVIGVFILFFFSFLLWFISHTVYFNGLFPWRTLYLEHDLAYGSREGLAEVVQNYVKVGFFALDVQKMQEDIASLSWVKSVRVDKIWPNDLLISIDERVPVVRFGERGFLDEEGVYFELEGFDRGAFLFTLYAPQGMEKKALQMYQAIDFWLKEHGIMANALLLDGRQAWRLILNNGVEVILGRENLNDGLKKLAFIQSSVVKPYGQYIDSLDLRYNEGFSVRWKKGVNVKALKE